MNTSNVAPEQARIQQKKTNSKIIKHLKTKYLTRNSKLELMPQISKIIKVGRIGRREGRTDRRTGGRVGGTGGRPGGWDRWVGRARAGRTRGRDPKPTLTLICADPKTYPLWSIHPLDFTTCKCRCWVRDHPDGILMDCEASMSISDTFRKL